MPILLRRSSINCLSFIARMSWPSMYIFPAVASFSLEMQRISVDLPEPDRPIMISNSPSYTSNEALFTPTMQPASWNLCGVDDAIGLLQHAVRIVAKNHVDRIATDDRFYPKSWFQTCEDIVILVVSSPGT